MGNYYENNWRTYATFSLTGSDFDPDEVTSFLKIQPSDSFRAGDLRRNGKPWKHSQWSLTTKDHVQSNDLSTHIEWLLDHIEPVHSYIVRLTLRGTEASIFCFWELLSGNGGPTFMPSLLRRLANLDLDLGLDFYCNCD